MRARLAWLVGIGAAAALAARALLGRRDSRQAPPPGSDARALELRRRLEESRALVEERDEFEERELPVDRVEMTAPDPDERRRRIHDEGRAALDEMGGDPAR